MTFRGANGRRWIELAPLLALLLVILGCQAETPRAEEPQPVTGSASVPVAEPPAEEAPADDPEVVDLVSPDIPPAVAGEDGWNYARFTEADLNGDGADERIVLTARVELYQGRPAWDDGQPWQVYVESADGARTYLYAQRLQLGSLDLRLTRPAAAGTPTILMIEHLPDRLAIYEGAMDPDGAALVRRVLSRPLDPSGEVASPRLP